MELKNFGATPEEVENYFLKARSAASDEEDITRIFNVALSCGGYSLFPYISMNITDYRMFIDEWIALYNSIRAVTPQNYRATPKAVTDDMSVVAIVTSACGMTEDEAVAQLKLHARYMGAEGVQGYLLEEYVAEAAARHNLLHCSGILKYVDVCSPDGSLLLQVKNKNNSEASPSLKAGASITRWYRVSPRKRDGAVNYVTNWQKLNAVLAPYGVSGSELSESGFICFIKDAVRKNNKILGG